MLCYALPCFPLLCFDFGAGPSPSLGRAGKCEKFTRFMQQFYPNRKFFEKIKFSTPFVGGTTAGPKKLKFTKRILSKAIALGGSSIKNFSSDNGKKGLFQQYFCVYGKKDEKCSKKSCGSNIIKIVISNRATFYCNKCQK